MAKNLRIALSELDVGAPTPVGIDEGFLVLASLSLTLAATLAGRGLRSIPHDILGAEGCHARHKRLIQVNQ
jgi:hypothetical protein